MFLPIHHPVPEDCLLPGAKEHSAFGWTPNDKTRLHDDLLENRHFATTN